MNQPSRNKLGLASGLVAVVAVGAGCSGQVDSFSIPDPPPTITTTPVATVTLPSNLASKSEDSVPGVTTTTLRPLKPGPDAMSGTVLGPAGPVGGATVEVDHFVGNTYTSLRTTSAADGRWSIDGIIGGRYRIRAWKEPNLAMSTPQLIFLSAGSGQALTLQLMGFPSPQIQVAINPAVPTVGQPANLVIEVDNSTVNSDGIETSAPLAGQSVTLVNGPAWAITGSNPAVTGTSGQVVFQITCTAAGAEPLSAQVGAAAPVTLQMPSCQA